MRTTTRKPARLPAANHENNVASDITEARRQQLVGLADQALDALSYARTCQTKGEALECWKELMGPSFNA